MPADAVLRMMLEGLADLMALMEDPARLPLPSCAMSVAARSECSSTRGRFRHSYSAELEELDSDPAVQLTEAERAHPAKIPRWPSMSRLLDRPAPPRLIGERGRFRGAVSLWYTGAVGDCTSANDWPDGRRLLRTAPRFGARRERPQRHGGSGCAGIRLRSRRGRSLLQPVALCAFAGDLGARFGAWTGYARRCLSCDTRASSTCRPSATRRTPKRPPLQVPRGPEG